MTIGKGEPARTKVITVEGMMCGMCEAHVAEALRKVPGVESAKADRNKKQATVTCAADVSDEALLKAIADTGYDASDVREAEPEKKGLFGFMKK